MSLPRGVLCGAEVINLQPVIHRGKTNAEGFRFAIVASRWNDFLTSKLIDGAVDALSSAGASDGDVEVFMVPGAFELPLAALKAAQSGKFDAVIAIGVVIRGETPHFDFIAQSCASGIADIAAETGIPVSFGVLTVDTLQQALDRSGDEESNKGYEAANTALDMISVLRKLES